MRFCPPTPAQNLYFPLSINMWGSWVLLLKLMYLRETLSCSSAGKESACNAGYLGSIPWLGRSPGEGEGYPLQYSGLENSMDCIVHGFAELDITESLSLSLSRETLLLLANLRENSNPRISLQITGWLFIRTTPHFTSSSQLRELTSEPPSPDIPAFSEIWRKQWELLRGAQLLGEESAEAFCDYLGFCIPCSHVEARPSVESWLTSWDQLSFHTFGIQLKRNSLKWSTQTHFLSLFSLKRAQVVKLYLLHSGTTTMDFYYINVFIWYYIDIYIILYMHT